MDQAAQAAHDAKIYALMEQESRVQASIDRTITRMHRLAGDKKHYEGRRQVWNMTVPQLWLKLKDMALNGDKLDLSAGATPSGLMDEADRLARSKRVISAQVEELEGVYYASPWTRWYPCLNSDGHIHASMRGCSTVRWDTDMGWDPELSGKTVEEAIAKLGERLCSVCFPDAPAKWCRSLAEINREQRAAEKTSRLAAKLAAEAAKTARQAERAARAARPRAATPAERRGAALNALMTSHQDDYWQLDREVLAAEVETLAALGKSEKWQHAIATWAKTLRDADEIAAYAWIQMAICTGYAAY